MIATKNIIRCRLNAGIEKVYPELEDVTLKATKESQTFKSETHYGYNEVTLEPINLEDKIVTPTKEQIIIESNTSDGLNSVTVEPIPDEYIKPTGTKEITKNGTYDVSNYSNANINVINIEKYKPRAISFSYYTGSELDYELENLDTTNVTSMRVMFNGCESLTHVYPLNTSKVTDMFSMFQSCKKLKAIPEPFDTTNVTNMDYIFSQCNALTSIPMLNTSKVTSMNCAFQSCSNITTIPNLNTSNVTNMSSLFRNCSKLTTIPQLDASKVDKLEYITGACLALTTFGGLLNLGKGFPISQSANYYQCTLDVSSASKLLYESLMNIINNLYDIQAKGCRTQKLVLGYTNLNKLTADEIAIATNKGWVVS